MTRLERKNITEVELGIRNSGGIFDLFDNQFKIVLRITDDEFDNLCEELNDDELGQLVTDNSTYAEKRSILKLLQTKIYNSNTKYTK